MSDEFVGGKQVYKQDEEYEHESMRCNRIVDKTPEQEWMEEQEVYSMLGQNYPTLREQEQSKKDNNNV